MLSVKPNLSRILFRNFARAPFIRVKTDVFEKLIDQRPQDIRWDSIRNDLIKNELTVNQTNIDAIIVSKCFNGAHLNIALSYMNYLKSNSLKINEATMCKIIRLYYNYYKKQNVNISAEHECEIIKFCNLVSGQTGLSEEKTDLSKIIDFSLAENIIHGLSITREWIKGLAYLEQMNMCGKKPTESSYNCLLVRAIKEDRDDIAWKLLNEMTSKDILPKANIFIEWFKHHPKNLQKIEAMLEFIGSYGLLLPEVEIQKIKQALNQHFSAKLVTINRTGQCPGCSQILPGVKLLPDEFSKLANVVLEQILKREDAFIKSNPEEIKKFQEFVDCTAPYDCVIDGLNVAYSRGNKLSPKVYVRNLTQVVRYFAENRKKCLIIGRKHMQQWPRKEMTYIRENSLLFLIEDLSHDDLFIIYAALKSGPLTNIFSRDLMRQHSHLLNSRLKSVFRRWQQEHQFQLVTSNNHKLVIKEPSLFELRAHKVGLTWHLPFTNENQYLGAQTFNLPTSWLCLREIKTNL